MKTAIVFFSVWFTGYLKIFHSSFITHQPDGHLAEGTQKIQVKKNGTAHKKKENHGRKIKKKHGRPMGAAPMK